MRRGIWSPCTLIALIAAATPVVAAASADEPRTPNVLIFLSDDVGWGEYGFQGGDDVPTPNIDRIARSGVTFRQGYVSGPYCSPTRAGLMTGRYQTRFGHEFNSTAGPNGPGLSLAEKTIAERFKALGYDTCAIGKWHLGFPADRRPMARGFDEFFGTLANTPFVHPTNFIDSRVSPDVRPVEDDAFYTTDAYGARAAEWITAHAERPWLLYVPFNAQHAPLQATPDRLERFAHIADEKRRTFAAMMTAMDDAVGLALDALRASGQEENTLVVFTSDNGGPTPSTTSRNGILRGFKATTWEGGVRVPFCMQWPGTIPAGLVYEPPIIQLDVLPTALAAAGSPATPADALDGVNLLPYLTGQDSGRPHPTLFWRFGDQWAIRHNDWKLVVARDGSGRPELYDLASDPSEQTDHASDRPEVLAELQALYDSWNAEQAPPLLPPERPADRRAARQKAASPKD